MRKLISFLSVLALFAPTASALGAEKADVVVLHSHDQHTQANVAVRAIEVTPDHVFEPIDPGPPPPPPPPA